MTPIDDFLTNKVREIHGMLKAMLTISGQVNPAVLFGLKGEEHGVPLDLRPFGDPAFLSQHMGCVQEAAEFAGIPAAALMAGVALGMPQTAAWPLIVAERLRQIRPDWFILIAMAFVVEGSRSLSLAHQEDGAEPALFIAGANCVRNFAVVTPFHRSPHGMQFGDTTTRDTITDGGGIGGPFVSVYLPGSN